MKIPEGIRENFLRADSGSYDGDFLYYLEMRKILYAIVVKLYPWIQIKLVGLKYRDIGGGISVGEMRYTGIGWYPPDQVIPSIISRNSNYELTRKVSRNFNMN